MKTNRKIASMAVMAIIFTSTACNSNETEKQAEAKEKVAADQPAATEPAAETAGSGVTQTAFADKYWVLESSVVEPAIDLNMDGKADTDIRVMLEKCELDDAEMFKSDGKLLKDFGSSKCDEEETNGKEVGNWKFDPATKQITSKHDDTEKPQVVTVKEVSGNKMVVTYAFTSSRGNHTITGIYKAK
ncbi:MAG: hypothetical protein J7578_20510 [Chitinophagaceae bacterium]|nr:hypothetical protein [Chitinophagaceae bacterium]